MMIHLRTHFATAGFTGSRNLRKEALNIVLEGYRGTKEQAAVSQPSIIVTRPQNLPINGIHQFHFNTIGEKSIFDRWWWDLGRILTSAIIHADEIETVGPIYVGLWRSLRIQVFATSPAEASSLQPSTLRTLSLTELGYSYPLACLLGMQGYMHTAEAHMGTLLRTAIRNEANALHTQNNSPHQISSFLDAIGTHMGRQGFTYDSCPGGMDTLLIQTASKQASLENPPQTDVFWLEGLSPFRARIHPQCIFILDPQSLRGKVTAKKLRQVGYKTHIFTDVDKLTAAIHKRKFDKARRKHQILFLLHTEVAQENTRRLAALAKEKIPIILSSDNPATKTTGCHGHVNAKSNPREFSTYLEKLTRAWNKCPTPRGG